MLIRPLVLSLAALVMTASSVVAAPALWKVSDEDSSIWLFGSVHLLPPDLDWRSARLDKVLSKADRVYFETDVSVEAQMRIMPMTFDLAYNRDGKLLSDTIGPKLTARVRQAAEDYLIPMPLLLTMRPWMAATTLSIGPLTDSGYDPLLGVEAVLGAAVPKERTGYLETPEQQIGFLASGSDEEQIAMLEATLDTLHVMQSDIDSMVDAWMAGTPELLGEVFMSQMGDYDDGMVTRLIDDRNRDWVEQIDAMLERNEKALLVVGAAHLVDEISVVTLLEERGFTSQRVQ
ncbi:TraB/GumN family protein [Devosia rhizoryzae]|uniref:TraB/GumN family protein n=1 Tax=Devosia rhizoryzae TaxID=2774137 RepID=A0ABX7C995_9HYPH|nr:TraB/GumN family protein [Devosia rhizoryzae]QQR40850.1 TraB/GumN family protein [Devosia rhizoryzae]